MSLKSHVYVKPKFDSPAGIELTLTYYCLAKDANEVQQIIWKNLIQSSDHNNPLKPMLDSLQAGKK